MLKNNQFACNIIQYDNKDICQSFDHHIVEGQQGNKYKHTCPVQHTGCNPAGKERNDFLQIFLHCGGTAVENPFAVGQVDKAHRQKPRKNCTEHRSNPEGMGKSPIGNDIHHG